MKKQYKRNRGFALPSNDGCELPTNILFVDTESNSRTVNSNSKSRYLSFRLACTKLVRFRNGEFVTTDEQVMYSIDTFWKYAIEKTSLKNPLTVIAHNAGFDMVMLRLDKQITESLLRIEDTIISDTGEVKSMRSNKRGCFIVEGKPFIVKLYCNNGKITILDSMNWLPMSLAKIAENSGMKKLTFPGDVASNGEMVTYCKNDVDILAMGIKNCMYFWENADGGNWKSTMSGMALTSLMHHIASNQEALRYQTIYMGTYREWAENERKAYYGGIVEAFGTGGFGTSHSYWRTATEADNPHKHKNVIGCHYKVDCNSLYPFIMMKCSLPIRRDQSFGQCSPSTLLDMSRQYGILAHVRLKTFYHRFPRRTGKRVDYLIGDFDTWLCGAELQRALDANCVIKAYSGYKYQLGNPISSWAKKWYARRLECRRFGYASGDMFCKLLMNSLAGKFAQKAKIWIETPEIMPDSEYGSWYSFDGMLGEMVHHRVISGIVQTQVDAEDKWFAFPAISAFITSAGRMHMMDAIKVAGRFNVLYIATDGLIVNGDGLELMQNAGLIDSEEPGKFKVQGCYAGGEIGGKNQYRLDNIDVTAGLPAGHEQNADGTISYDVFELPVNAMLRNSKGEIQVTRVTAKTPLGHDGFAKQDFKWTERKPVIEPETEDKAR